MNHVIINGFNDKFYMYLHTYMARLINKLFLQFDYMTGIIVII